MIEGGSYASATAAGAAARPGLGVTLDRAALARLHCNYLDCGDRVRDDAREMRKHQPDFDDRARASEPGPAHRGAVAPTMGSGTIQASGLSPFRNEDSQMSIARVGVIGAGTKGKRHRAGLRRGSALSVTMVTSTTRPCSAA